MDGVVVDSTHAWWVTFNEALRHFGFPPVSEKKFMGEILGESTQDDVEKYYPGVTVEKLLAAYDRFFRKNLKNVRVFPDTKLVLEQLSSLGVKKAIATNTPKELAFETLKSTKILSDFDVVLTPDDVGAGKPDPAMILEACRRLGANVKEIIYVGDTVSDVKAAEAAGCRMIGVGVDADTRVTRLREIIPLVTGRAQKPPACTRLSPPSLSRSR
jgi:HAD superfamily hydrolase (TIGR01509 family)